MCVYIPTILLSERACLGSMCEEFVSSYALRMCEEFVSSYELHILREELLTSFKVVKSTIGSTMTCRILSFAVKNLELLPLY